MGIRGELGFRNNCQVFGLGDWLMGEVLAELGGVGQVPDLKERLSSVLYIYDNTH